MADAGTWTIITTSSWVQMQQNFQIYQIASILLVFAIIGFLVLFKDSFPFIWARFVSHDVIVGVLNKDTRLIKPNKDFKKYNGMFYYKGEPLPFIKAYPGNFLFTGLPFDLLEVELSTITDPRYRKACSDLRANGYANINALEKAVVFSQMTPDDPRMLELISREGYADYEDAREHINPKNLTIDHDIVKQFFTAIPLSDLLGYGTTVPSEDILGEVDDVYEARKPSMQVSRDIQKILPACIIIFVAAAAVVVIYIAFFKG
jgi:hypothetical protein